MRLRAAAWSILLVASSSGAGCAHTESAADRHFAELSDAVGKVQAEQDRDSERLGRGMVEASETENARAPVKAAAPPKAPAQRTVQIGADADDGESDDPNDPTARPEIRLQGQGGATSRPVRGKTRGKGEAKIEPSDMRADDVRENAARAPILDPEAKRSYESALSLVNAKQYDRALEALGVFLVRWPDHPYVENARYWKGEVHFARGEYLRAVEEFEAALARGGSKTPDALLKIGMCHDRLGSSDRAKEYWERLRRDYPRSDAAKKFPHSSDDARRGPKEPR
jgi:tol-pal system protein YbgF